ncbi:hypothetical protein PV328_002559 [Microctonus aethiopoides]|uniref:Mannosyl-oligosaccharide 1,2-alpha-mannosidase IA n=1 Tax=Microctonus aethiopoides TaxID=144406 RepID=A0AA39F6M5_9HYME|nr:hypothetical protein PV328_002559 [Microctonus aethiopoides]
MVGKSNILPSYQRFVNGVPVSLFSRRAFRPREKYLIFLVFLTFGVVCFGAFFFLPDFRSGTGGAYNSVYEVYRKIQKAGPELLIPAPPHGVLGPIDPHGPGGYQSGQIHVGLERPGAAIFQDIHLIEDKQKLQAKIDEEYQNQKTLEKPEMIKDLSERVSSSASPVLPDHRKEENIQTVPPALADVLPLTVGGEDKDPVARQRRDKVKEVTSTLDTPPSATE